MYEVQTKLYQLDHLESKQVVFEQVGSEVPRQTPFTELQTRQQTKVDKIKDLALIAVNHFNGA
jgi:hypothetical protein